MISPKIFSKGYSRYCLRENSLENEQRENQLTIVVSLPENEKRRFLEIDNKRRRRQRRNFRLRGGGISSGFVMPNMQPIPMGYQPPTPMICYPGQQAPHPPDIPYPCPPVVMYNLPYNAPSVFGTFPQTTPMSGFPTPSISTSPQMIPQLQQLVPPVQPRMPHSNPSFQKVRTTDECPAKNEPFSDTKRTTPLRRFTLPAMKLGEYKKRTQSPQEPDSRTTPKATSDNVSIQVDFVPDEGILNQFSKLPSQYLRTSFIQDFGDDENRDDKALASQHQLTHDIVSSFVQRKKNIVLHLMAAKAMKEKLDSGEEVKNTDELLHIYHQHKIDALEQIRKCMKEKTQIQAIVRNVDKNVLKLQNSPREDVAIRIHMTSQSGDAPSLASSSRNQQCVVFPPVNQLLSEGDPLRTTSGNGTCLSSNYPSSSTRSYAGMQCVDNTLSEELTRQKEEEEKRQILEMLCSFFQHRRSKVDTLLKLK